MSEFKKNIDNIRNYYNEFKYQNYPIENQIFLEKDELFKSYYFRMLYALIRYSGEPKESQVTFFKRLLSGCKVEKNFKEYIRLALEIDITVVENFLELLQKDVLKYYFSIDALILLVLGDESNDVYLFYSEILDMLKFSKQEIKYVSNAVKAIIEQDTSLFDLTRNLLPESMYELNLFEYVKDFYSGVIINNPIFTHIYSKDKKEYDIPDNLIQSQNVVLENLILNKNITIGKQGIMGQTVTIKNCDITATNLNVHSNSFSYYEKVNIENCEFKKFNKYTVCFDHIKNIFITNSKFFECRYISDNGQITGIVLHDLGYGNKLILEKTVFVDCGTQTKYNKKLYSTDCVISNIEYVEINNCTFANCNDKYLEGAAKNLNVPLFKKVCNKSNNIFDDTGRLSVELYSK